MPDSFLASTAPLRFGDAVAAILVLEDGRYILQRRDDLPGIWYPDHWGFFGGGIESGEDALAALGRELEEELTLAIDIATARLFARFDFDLSPDGLRRFYRNFYVVPIAGAALGRARLKEGAEVKAFSGAEALGSLRLTPYDSFALFLHYARGRVVG